MSSAPAEARITTCLRCQADLRDAADAFPRFACPRCNLRYDEHSGIWGPNRNGAHALLAFATSAAAYALREPLLLLLGFQALPGGVSPLVVIVLHGLGLAAFGGAALYAWHRMKRGMYAAITVDYLVLAAPVWRPWSPAYREIPWSAVARIREHPVTLTAEIHMRRGRSFVLGWLFLFENRAAVHAFAERAQARLAASGAPIPREERDDVESNARTDRAARDDHERRLMFTSR